MIRYVVLLAAYIEHDDILAGTAGQVALGLFQSSWVTSLFLVVAGLAADRTCRPLVAGRAAAAAPRPRMRVLLASSAVIAGLGALAGLAWTFVPPGTEKSARILIDDRFCGIWEPTARRLDTDWYGDFPTYSFTSLAEWLGKWFSVDANTSRSYNADLLSRYDVLIIKTPEEPIPEAEAAAIDRFVRAGGGLLLVGDHTNLLGMGTHLNAQSAQLRHPLPVRFGVRRSDWRLRGLRRTPVRSPPGGAACGPLGNHDVLLASALRRAERILAVEDCQREPHDYSGSSFFGRRGPHPEMDQGRTVLAATVRVGRGRIAAFTDSTVWSSFAVFSHDREKLAMDLVRLLNREPSGYEIPVRCIALVATSLAVLVGLAMIGSGMALPALLFLLVGCWAGVAVSDALHRRVYAWPAPMHRFARWPSSGREASVRFRRFWERPSRCLPTAVSTPCSLQSSAWDSCPGLLIRMTAIC